MATFLCREYPTMTVHLPTLGRDIQLAHGEYTAADEAEAEAIRAVIADGYFPAYEEDRAAAAARATLARTARAASERAQARGPATGDGGDNPTRAGSARANAFDPGDADGADNPTLPAPGRHTKHKSQIERDDDDPEDGVSTVVRP